MRFLSVAIVDTGISPDALGSKCLLPGINLTTEGGTGDTTDHNGHGTLIAATVRRRAPQAPLVPVKAMGRWGYPRSGHQLEAAFQWILDNRERLGIGLVCAAFSDAGSSVDDESFRGTRLQRQVEALRNSGTLTVAPAGGAHAVRPGQGMAWPAVLREVVSVGEAVQDGRKLRIARSSQRLHAQCGGPCRTTAFALADPPGGTSGAAAAVAGRLAALLCTDLRQSADDLLKRLLRNGTLIRDKGLHWPVVR